ncbi:hypothetical protein [Pyxidicoccus caerfyrddinensis]|uniref:hypothetical protein n=1 Tax=Pyxidicoccus caerfyrddinensis TaxID=2709663 RepID=UPI0013DB4100|nr:hypothetical protein [Pyxidicoccus caerfyrddinensis]
MSAPTVWQHRVRGEKGQWLADVVLRSDGFFAAVSGWGSYAFRWTHPGMPFRAFVAQLEGQDSYVCSKLDRRDWFDGEATLKSIRQHILEYRRDGNMSKAEAAKEWDILTDIVGGGVKAEARDAGELDLYQYFQWHDRTGLGDASEFGVYGYHPDLRGFCREVMPRLATLLRAELAAAVPNGERTECSVDPALAGKAVAP